MILNWFVRFPGDAAIGNQYEKAEFTINVTINWKQHNAN